MTTYQITKAPWAQGAAFTSPGSIRYPGLGQVSLGAGVLGGLLIWGALGYVAYLALKKATA